MTTAFTSNTQQNAAGILNYATGKAVTTSASASATAFTVGFVPRVVRWVNATDRIVDVWYSGMAADSALETAANGTVTLETSGGITVGTDGTFTVHADLIVASKTHYWEAIG